MYEEANESAAGMGFLNMSFQILRNFSIPNSVKISIGIIVLYVNLIAAQFALISTTDQLELARHAFSQIFPGGDFRSSLNFVYHDLQIRVEDFEASRAEAITLKIILGGNSSMINSYSRNRH